MLRSDWTFEYQAGKLLEAAEKEFQRREERIEYWKEKREEVLIQLKEKGLDVTNWSEGGFEKSSVGTRIDVQFDQKLIGRLRECEQWLLRARNDKKEYSMWIQAFSECQDSQSFQLEADDIGFFGLGKSVEPDFVAPEDAEMTTESSSTPGRITTPAPMPTA